jgi:hypothetical protein
MSTEEMKAVAADAIRKFVEWRQKEAETCAKDIENEESFQEKKAAHAAAFNEAMARIEPTRHLLEERVADFIRGSVDALVREVPLGLLPDGAKPAVRLGEAKASHVVFAKVIENPEEKLFQSCGYGFIHTGVVAIMPDKGIDFPLNIKKELDVSVEVNATSPKSPPTGFCHLNAIHPMTTYVVEHQIDEANGNITETHLYIIAAGSRGGHRDVDILLNVQPVRTPGNDKITDYSIAVMQGSAQQLANVLARVVVSPAMKSAGVLARTALNEKAALHGPRLG